MDPETVVGVAFDNLVSDHAQALVAGRHFPCDICFVHEVGSGAVAREVKIALTKSEGLSSCPTLRIKPDKRFSGTGH